MKFKPILKRQRISRSFDPDKKITMANKTFIVRDKIQEAREDTEIYPTLEKYGTLERMKIIPDKVYGDFTKMTSLKDIMDQQIEAKRLWDDLPWDVRKHFNNNIKTFIKEGEKYLKEQVELAKPKVEPVAETTQPITTPTQGE